METGLKPSDIKPARSITENDRVVKVLCSPQDKWRLCSTYVIRIVNSLY